VWGVQTLYTDAVLLRVVARTEPLRQWEVQRELTERLKNTLDATGMADGPGADAGPVAVPAGVGSPASAPGVATAGAAGEASHPGHVT
jgi:moderate conductance mechanosensitive channel